MFLSAARSPEPADDGPSHAAAGDPDSAPTPDNHRIAASMRIESRWKKGHWLIRHTRLRWAPAPLIIADWLSPAYVAAGPELGRGLKALAEKPGKKTGQSSAPENENYSQKRTP